MKKSIIDIIKNFNTTPFLFIGAGLTRRYYDLPDWRSLLEIFAKKVDNDEFAYNKYELKAKSIPFKTELYPKVAELIEKDFNDKWFSDPSIRTLDDKYLSFIMTESISPFKVEIATYIKNNSTLLDKYINEAEKFRKISKKSLSGIITTNYDLFLEENTDNYNSYIGQEELLFSNTQGIAEIYKIHGCITNPKSIVINENDYIDFEKKSPYLASKLMTIFVEYPIIFMGYSLSDSNVRRILKSIIDCLSEEKLKILEDRFIFVEYKTDSNDVNISSHSISIDDKTINMTKISLKDFSILYDALENKKNKIPAKILRTFKDEFYRFTLTNEPTSKIRVGKFDDSRIEDDDLILAFGRASEYGLVGLKGLETDYWYKEILIDSFDFSADEMLEIAYPILLKKSQKIPFLKFLFYSEKDFFEYRQKAKKMSFDKDIINKTILKHRSGADIPKRNILGIWNNIEFPLEKKTRLMSYLLESEINVDDLENVLKCIYDNNNNIFSADELKKAGSNIRLLTRIFDFLKYKDSI
ncbi:SIR2 family protein [Clostridioides sp. ZZV14-6387]|uniref:SIR2 family protein n=1 Tax=Clostridioides sp. ZZV14-6387 TaxID=2811497 RepID=UPI001D112913|nr:SIR2 family protein [Clostridioides sp. ZZV14-6387]